MARGPPLLTPVDFVNAVPFKHAELPGISKVGLSSSSLSACFARRLAIISSRSPPKSLSSLSHALSVFLLVCNGQSRRTAMLSPSVCSSRYATSPISYHCCYDSPLSHSRVHAHPILPYPRLRQPNLALGSLSFVPSSTLPRSRLSIRSMLCSVRDSYSLAPLARCAFCAGPPPPTTPPCRRTDFVVVARYHPSSPVHMFILYY